MAKVTAKFPVDKISGTLGHIDRTVGIEGGLSCRICKSHSPGTLGVKTQATKTRTPGQLARAEIYCNCDQEFKPIPANKKYYLGIYWAKVMGKSNLHMTNYTVWMGICMRTGDYKNLFLANSFVTRYFIFNNSPAPWVSKKAKLTNITMKQPDASDIIVYIISTKHELINTVSHSVIGPGEIMVCLPDINSQQGLWIDVYSYGDYSSSQNCTGAWQNFSQIPGTTEIGSLEYIPENIVLASTSSPSRIFRSNDLGLTWYQTWYMPNYSSINDICSLQNGTVLASVWGTTYLLRSTNNGNSFTWFVKPYTGPTLICLEYLGNGVVLGGTHTIGSILRSIDYGQSWTNLGQQAGETYINTILYLENEIALAGTYPNAKILRSTDNGLTWNVMYVGNADEGVWRFCNLGNNIIIAGTFNSARILRSTDNGVTWTDLQLPISFAYIYSIGTIGNGIAFFGTLYGGRIYNSLDYGLTWYDMGNQYNQDGISAMVPIGNNVLLAGTAYDCFVLRYAAPSLQEFSPLSIIKIGPT